MATPTHTARTRTRPPCTVARVSVPAESWQSRAEGQMGEQLCRGTRLLSQLGPRCSLCPSQQEKDVNDIAKARCQE